MANKTDDNKNEKNTNEENPMKIVKTTSIPVKLQYSEYKGKNDVEKERIIRRD